MDVVLYVTGTVMILALAVLAWMALVGHRWLKRQEDDCGCEEDGSFLVHPGGEITVSLQGGGQGLHRKDVTVLSADIFQEASGRMTVQLTCQDTASLRREREALKIQGEAID